MWGRQSKSLNRLIKSVVTGVLNNRESKIGTITIIGFLKPILPSHHLLFSVAPSRVCQYSQVLHSHSHAALEESTHRTSTVHENLPVLTGHSHSRRQLIVEITLRIGHATVFISSGCTKMLEEENCPRTSNLFSLMWNMQRYFLEAALAHQHCIVLCCRCLCDGNRSEVNS